MGVLWQICQLVHACRRHIDFFAQRQPVGRVLLGHQLPGDFVQGIDVASSRCHGDKARVCGQGRFTQGREESLPVRVGIRHHADMAIAGFVGPPPGRQNAGVAGRRLRRLEVRPVEMFHQVERHHGFKHGDLNQGALASGLTLCQGRQNRHCGDQATGFVCRHRRKVAGCAALRLDQCGVARHALNDVVIGGFAAVRPVLVEAQQVGQYQTRVTGTQCLRGQTQTFKLLGANVVHEHIAASNQRLHCLLACGLFQVDDDALLVSVHPQKHRRHAALRGRACLSR